MDLTNLTLRRVINTVKIHTIHQNNFPPRRWDAFVFYLSGECTYEYEGMRFKAKEGDFVYLPSGQPYTAHFIAPATSCLLINFDGDMAASRSPICRRPENPGQIRGIFEAVLRLERSLERSRQAWMLSSLYQLIALMEAPAPYRPGSKREKLKKAVEILEKEYCRADLRCAQLAKACHMSEKYFQQLFRAVYAMTPGDYIAQKRLQKAQQMLVESDAPIGRIALECGYNSLYYFSRAFKAAIGQSPSEYRKSASIT